MKAKFHKVPSKAHESFSIRHDIQKHFPTIWHYHPELEIHHVVKGQGVRFIGDKISEFRDGDVVLMGANIPHTWRCDEEYFTGKSKEPAEAAIIHFLPNFLGDHFHALPEAYMYHNLLQRSVQGMSFNGATKQRLSELIFEMLNADGLKKVSIMLEMIDMICRTMEFEPLVAPQAFSKINEFDRERINRVCTYVLENYKNQITIQSVSEMIHLSETSFCRYFKNITKKTFLDFLTEIRVSHACKLLLNEYLSVEAICSECGFNNIANFYRHFKKVTGKSPIEYRKDYLKNRKLESLDGYLDPATPA